MKRSLAINSQRRRIFSRPLMPRSTLETAMPKPAPGCISANSNRSTAIRRAPVATTKRHSDCGRRNGIAGNQRRSSPAWAGSHPTAGVLVAAGEEIENALGFFETSRSTLASRDLRTSFFSSKHAYYDLAIAILMRLHAAEPARGYGEEAFGIAERANSRALLDEMAGRGVPQFASAPADLLQEQQANQNHPAGLLQNLQNVVPLRVLESCCFRRFSVCGMF